MIGTTIAGKYKLAAELGSGATGTVFRGDAVDGSGPVAVKVLRKEMGGGATRAEVERRFEREALAAALAQHPNCVTVRDFGALDDGRPYLVMDFVQGRSVADLVAAEKILPVTRALRILAHILRGLDHAHRAGVVHRDLKPADILLVDRDGDRDTAVILDFGTAALIGAAGASQEPLTRAGTTIGTPLYMAPERLGMEPVDGRADLYSASCILFEMVTGKPPYDADDPVGVLKAHSSAPIPTMAEAAPEVKSSAGLDAVLMRGLAKIPANRFQNAAEYLGAVEQLIEGKLDPLSLGRAAPGALAQPDAAKATTVFHGAPDQIRAVAAKMQAPGRMPAATPVPSPRPAPVAGGVAPVEGARVALPPLPQMQQPAAAVTPAAPPADAALAVAVDLPPPSAADAPQAGVMQPVAAKPGGTPASRKKIFIAAGAGAFVLLVILLASRGCGDKKSSDDPTASLTDAWKKAGLDPGGFAPIDGQKLGNGTCKSGAVNGLDVTVCKYKGPEQAAQARKAALASIGSTTGAAIVEGPQLLVVADRKSTDPSGRSIDKLIKVFQGKPLERPKPEKR